jgi:drug/metabolite transporter (DMT)-like permease
LSKQSKHKLALLELHFAVLLFGFTAILGELITLSALRLTWWRVLLASLFFLIMPAFVKRLRHIKKDMILKFAFVGILVALHWYFFYASIKSSNASLTLICLATTSFFTSLVEPLILNVRHKWIQILTGLIIVPGMYFVVQGTGFTYLEGLLFGLISAVLAAIFGSLNKKWLQDNDPISVTTVEMVSATAILTVGLFFSNEPLNMEEFIPQNSDIVYLLLLSLVCTNLAYVLALRVLRYISAFTAALTINLEPLYGILLAMLILKQHNEMNWSFYIGAFIILISVFGYPLIQKTLKETDL